MRKGRLLAMGAFTAIVVVATAAAAPTVPTGTLVFATAGDRADRFEIAVAKPDGTGVRKITHNTPGGEFPTWSADGQRIIFRSQDSATNFGRLWSVKKTGTGLHAVRRYGEPSPSATRFARPTLAGVDIFSRSGNEFGIATLFLVAFDIALFVNLLLEVLTIR